MIRRLKRATKLRHSARLGRGYVVDYYPTNDAEFMAAVAVMQVGDTIYLPV